MPTLQLFFYCQITLAYLTFHCHLHMGKIHGAQNVAFSSDAGDAYVSAIPQRHGGFPYHLSCICTMSAPDFVELWFENNAANFATVALAAQAAW